MKRYAVLDTNVIVSALLKWNSVPGVVLQAVFHGIVVPVFNDEILNEYRNVLNRPKFGFSSELISETISQIEALGIQESALESIAVDMPDPKDVVFYSIALAHGRTAETHLVTGNVKHFPENPIVVTPRQMLDILLEENDRMIAELKLKHAIEEGERSAEQKGWMTVNDVRKKYEV